MADTELHPSKIVKDNKSTSEISTRTFGLPQAALELACEHFDLLSLLGSGTQGIVLKARCKHSNRVVALKYIDSVNKDFYKIKQILRELLILSHLSGQPGGRYITRLLGVVSPKNLKEGDFMFLVMERVRGLNLKQFLDQCHVREQELTEETVIHVMYHFLCALNVIHSTNLIHRDIKPANILISENFDVKICDFGLSRCLPHTDQVAQQTTPMAKSERREVASYLKDTKESRKKSRRDLSPHIVSRIYRPPEIILLETYYDFHVDIWSAGCILSEMVLVSDQYDLSESPSSARYLFKAQSCYPLTPPKPVETEGSSEEEDSDLLSAILGVIGDQSNSDVSFVSKNSKASYVIDKFQKIGRVHFELEFSKTNPKICQLLQSMLQFNPYFRQKASELLKNPIFDPVRNKTLEKASQTPLQFSFDSANAYDYDKLESCSFTKGDLLDQLQKEADRLQWTGISYFGE